VEPDGVGRDCKPAIMSLGLFSADAGRSRAISAESPTIEGRLGSGASRGGSGRGVGIIGNVVCLTGSWVGAWLGAGSR